MIRVGVLGAIGYVGQELVRLLYRHPQVKIEVLGSRSGTGTSYADVCRQWQGILDHRLEDVTLLEAADRCDLVFLALPHGIAGGLVTEKILEKVRVIDMGADFRLSDPSVYEKWYGQIHPHPDLLPASVYGLSEFVDGSMEHNRLIANPGCFTTCSILALLPLMAMEGFDHDSVVIDAKSGVSGAGRGVGLGTHYAETNENSKAYKIAAHRHTPEIEEQLSLAAGRSLRVLFSPHLVPMNRGILVTAYIRSHQPIDLAMVHRQYHMYYKGKSFVRILELGALPETRWVKGTNYCDIALVWDDRTQTLVVNAALDNLMKGAAGQGIQNMNRLFGWPEQLGLDFPALFPV